MTKLQDREPKSKGQGSLWPYPLAFVFISVLAMISTFILANSQFTLGEKSRGFSAIIAVYLIFCFCIYMLQKSRTTAARETAWSHHSGAFVESRLLAFDRASELFGGSLKPADMFRLVSSRIGELMPFRTSVLYLVDETRSRLQIAEVAGENTEGLKGRSIRLDEGLAGKCFSGGAVEIGLHPWTEEEDFLAADTNAIRSAVAIPLRREGEVFGVLLLYLCSEPEAESTALSLFEAIGTRVAPLILNSVAFDRSIANALTDPTTDQPNERAFFLILENQIAESQRKRDERPLTILAIDIKEFDEVNAKYGHAAGDRVLSFVAQNVKKELRQMDFFARSSNDEFLVILPTATEQVSLQIMARIQTMFFANRLKLTEADAIQIELNCGWATFWNDGETAEQLLKTARLRKHQSKSTEPQKVLWFPKEFVN